ncbi:hypothetical protein [Pseudonocardia sp. HH130630-07]|uniref:hypothetical protein n=1 Tax=Pseudonocardia sp. HH130630-07 TaxID=1690815 RepID=UPI0018D29966|nr:hypothetical protein [Pseudonocardia sp. HH130630-07]
MYDARNKTAAEYDAELHRMREELRRGRAEVEAVHDWLLTNLAPIKTPTQSSYALKHVVEQAIGRYVSNGQLIAAALMAGYPTSRPAGPNVLVAVSRRDLDRVRARR